MKRTTFIILALFVLGLFAIPIILKTLIDEKNNDSLSMEGERTEIDMSGIRRVKIVRSGKVDKDRIEVQGRLDVQPSPYVGKSVFAYPKNKYLNVTQEEDCLLIEVDLDSEDISRIIRNMKNGRRLILRGLDMELKADSTLFSIENHSTKIGVNVKKMSLDSLYLFNDERQFVSLDSCSFRSLDVKGKGVVLNMNMVNATNCYLDLDTYIGGASIQFFIDNLYLTGKRSHKYRSWNSCKRIVWNPKTRDAELELTLNQKSEIIFKH